MLHTPLLRNPDKSKLSKRHGHASVSWYREQGYLPEAVVNFLASRIWNHPEGKEIYDVEELIRLFDIKTIHIMSPIVDLKKLDWMNGLWIRSLSDQELTNRLQPYVHQDLSLDLLIRVLPLVKERLIKLSDISQLTTFFYQEPNVDIKAILKEAKSKPLELKNYFIAITNTLEAIITWDANQIERSMRQLQEKHGFKPRQAFMSLRLCLTGQAATPPLFDVMELLGSKTCIKRLRVCIDQL
jgi:glutamyl/glutaminyl-tRNA synthetase